MIPKEVEEDVLDLAKQKAAMEHVSRKELLEGRTLREVYDKYGAL